MVHTKPGLTAVEAMAAPPAPASTGPTAAQIRADREARRRDRMRYRLRHQTAPHKVLVAVWSAAWLARAAVWLTGDAEAVAAATAGTAGLAAVIVAMVLRRGRTRQVRTWLYTCLAAAVTWLTVAAGNGVDWTMTAALAGIGFGLATPWWRYHRIPNVTPATAPTPAFDLDSVPALWAANVASKGGALPESYLTDPQISANKERYNVQLRAGRQSIATAMAALTLIASGLHVAQEDIVLERHDSGDASRVALTVVRKSPIKVSQPYRGPQLDYDPATGVGTVFLGPYADGEGLAPWKLFSHNSIWGGLVVGGIGSGKSRLLEALLCSMRDSGLVTTFYGDPQGGTSSDALASNATWAARGNEQIMAMLRGLDRLVYWRGIENSARGRNGFTPRPDRPGILAVLDECHMILSDAVYGEEATAICERIGRVGRKLGIALILASQEGDLPTFGGSNGLRNAVRRGNTVVLRTTNTQTASVLNLDFDPTLLPDLPGYGYTVAPVGTTDRTAPFRSYYLAELTDDELDAVHAGAEPREGTSHWWLAHTPDAPLDGDLVALRALGTPYAERNVAVEAARAELTGQLDDLISGRIDAVEFATPKATPADAGQAAGYGKVVAFPGALNLDAPVQTPTTAAAPAAAPDPSGLTPAARDVYQAIKAGTTRKGELVTLTGLSDSGVIKALSELMARGDVVKARHGHYGLAGDQPATDAADVAVDELLRQAVALVVTSGIPTPAMLTRRLTVTTEQARWLLDRMTETGVLGPAGPDGTPTVLVTADQLDQTLADIDA
ncbi:hypothetical protein [Micromonospora sp. RV43]|uniref:hypothetical protein n=1 Tax=Micromonospora sp. RV43 TaxID=1661387 RepID=UPI00064BFD45|nr:hypothetical protein [Micromonospora sp. RV43]